MALAKLPYKRLQQLIGLHLSTTEEASTAALMKELSLAKKRGYLNKSELVKVCKWKSPRAIRHILRNRAESVRDTTRTAFSTRSEQKRMELLISLNGVSIPMASAILTLTNPVRYGVMDIRVWQLLFTMRAVTTNARGTGFRLKEWLQFLALIRFYARKHGVNARDVERTLFNVHSRYQSGLLYRK